MKKGIAAGGFFIIALAVLLYFRYKAMQIQKLIQGTGTSEADLLQEAANFIAPLEGFSSSPYWDNLQWSWGYGTACGFDKTKKPVGKITVDQAKIEMQKYLSNSLNEFASYLKKPLSKNKMVALLSFNYNLGIGNTKNIFQSINAGMGDWDVVDRMKKYVNAGGKVSQTLVNRRLTEANKYLA